MQAGCESAVGRTHKTAVGSFLFEYSVGPYPVALQDDLKLWNFCCIQGFWAAKQHRGDESPI